VHLSSSRTSTTFPLEGRGPHRGPTGNAHPLSLGQLPEARGVTADDARLISHQMSSAPVDPTVSPGRERGLRGFIAKRLAKRAKRHHDGPGARPGLERDSVDPVVRASKLAKAKSRRFAREVRPSTCRCIRLSNAISVRRQDEGGVIQMPSSAPLPPSRRSCPRPVSLCRTSASADESRRTTALARHHTHTRTHRAAVTLSEGIAGCFPPFS
jgi:hypothetical protein